MAQVLQWITVDNQGLPDQKLRERKQTSKSHEKESWIDWLKVACIVSYLYDVAGRSQDAQQITW